MTFHRGATASRVLTGSETFDVQAEDGGAYRILLFVPDGPPPSAGWPLLCLTDGNAVFATARDIARVQASHPKGTNVGAGVVAAIGYPIDEPHDAFRRSWDLSPPPGRSYPPFVEGGPPVRTGGAAQFLDLIERRIKPQIAARVPIDPSRRSLFGHSFGGLFALYTLFTRPAAFSTYIAASPTLYWEDEVVAGLRDAYLASCAQGPETRVFLSAGEYEGDALPPFQRGLEDSQKRQEHLRRMGTVAMAADLAGRLNAASQGRVHAIYETFAGENHMSVLPVAVNRAVQAAFSLDPDRQFDPGDSL